MSIYRHKTRKFLARKRNREKELARKCALKLGVHELVKFLGHYCLWASASLVCCLNIVVKLWNSCIFKWLSRLVNKPWMLYRLDLKTSKRHCEHCAHTSFKQCVFEIDKEMSIEGCYCGLSFSCELIDHAMSGIALPERMKRRISFSDTWTKEQL